MDSVKQMMLQIHTKEKNPLRAAPRLKPSPPPTPAPQIPPSVKGKEGKLKPDLAGYYF